MKKKTYLSKGILTFACFVILSSCKKDGNFKEDAQLAIAVIDTKVEQWMAQNNMPGISLAISNGGKLVYSKGYGVTEQSLQNSTTAVTTESQFRIASVSKLITSAAVMKLVQDGKVKMNDRVFGTNGLLGNTYGTQPYKMYVTDVTVSDLLHHTTGGWSQTNDPAFFDISMDDTSVINWTLDNLALTNKPGTTFAYSNFGYMLLEKIVEKTSGKGYVQYVNDEIWNKVGAKQSVLAGSKASDKLPKEVSYHGQSTDEP